MVKQYIQIGLTPSRSNLNDEEVKFPLKLLWRAQAQAPFVCTPLITDDTVYVDSTSFHKKGRSDSKLFAFDAMTGEKKWEYLYQGGGGLDIIVYTKEW